MSRTRTFVVAAAVIAGASFAALTAPTGADAKLRVGIADQKPDTYSNPFYTQELKVRRTRIIVPWNFSQRRGKGENPFLVGLIKTILDRKNIELMVHFGKDCNGKCKLPSVSKYRKAFKKFRQQYPKIKIIGIWNEANHGDQPTKDSPKRVAEYYNAARKVCPTKCKLVGLDVLDDASLPRYTKEFLETAKSPKYIGLHNYKDVNDRKSTSTRALYKALKNRDGKVKQEIWLTETGGLNFFKTGKGKVVRKRSDERQRKAVKYLFELAQKSEFKDRITRIYYYHWKSDGLDEDKVRFDAGLLDPDGNRRPAYFEVLKNKKFLK